jgi:purine-binding chemotaxis protein CheW
MSNHRQRMKERIEQVPEDILALLNRRAERLREAALGEADEEAVLWVAEFPIGEEHYAIALSALRAAVPLRTVTPVPLSAPHVVGVLRFQGQIVTALSLASLIGSRGWRQDPAVLLVVDPGWGALTALDCEQIPKPAALPVAAIEQAKARGAGAIMEVTTQDMRLVNYIDVARLLDRRANAEGVRNVAG